MTGSKILQRALFGLLTACLLAAGPAPAQTYGQQPPPLPPAYHNNQGHNPPPAQNRGGNVIFLKRYRDRTENAFSVLVPPGWRPAGGIGRVDPNKAGGPANALEARLELSVSAGNANQVVVAWLPHTYYADMRNSQVGGMYRQGSNYFGMMVMNAMDPVSYVTRLLFPRLPRMQYTNPQVIEQKPLPQLAGLYQALFNRAVAPVLRSYINCSYSAAMVTVAYQTQQGVMHEKIISVMEYRKLGTLMQWCGRLTMVFRCPADQWRRWAPLMAIVAGSLKFNPDWVKRELQGQVQRGEIALRTQEEIQRIDNEIVQHRQKTNAEIAKTAFETLMGKQGYKDPFTGKRTVGPIVTGNGYVDQEGNMIVSENPNFNPDLDPNYHNKGFKKLEPWPD